MKIIFEDSNDSVLESPVVTAAIVIAVWIVAVMFVSLDVWMYWTFRKTM